MTTNLNVLSIIAVLLLILPGGSSGTRPSGCGSGPAARPRTPRRRLGVNVIRYKFMAVLISGGLAGLAGGFLVLVASNLYREGQTAGRGYIGLAAMIFGNWRPGGLAGGAGAVRLHRRDPAARRRRRRARLPAAHRDLPRRLGRLAPRPPRQGKPAVGVVTVILGILSFVWFLGVTRVSNEFTGMTPYVATLLVLAFASQRLRPPAADGKVYRKGEAT